MTQRTSEHRPNSRITASSEESVALLARRPELADLAHVAPAVAEAIKWSA